MQFKRATVTISVGVNAQKIFEQLDKLRPQHVSMSAFIATVADEYVKTHNNNSNLLDFAETNVEASLPLFYAPIQKWEEKVRTMSSEDFIKLQQRHDQLGNMIRTYEARKL